MSMCRIILLTLLVYKFVIIITPQTVKIISNEINGKISGGQEAVPHEAPWLISIQYFNNLTQLFHHLCGGSIIKPHLILTAGHCLLEFRFEMGYIFAGLHNLDEAEVYTQQNRSFNYSSVIVHEGYNYGTTPNDVGLIKLIIPFVMTNYIQSISLPSNGVIPIGYVRLFGWGITQVEGNRSDVLITGNASVFDNNLCNLTFTSLVLDSHFCTSSNDLSACFGDSGSSVVQQNVDGIDEIIGIMSWGFSLCGKPPSVHTRVSAFIDWIAIDSAESFQLNCLSFIVLFILAIKI